MSIFTMPSSLCDEIEKMMNSFWWGHSGTHNKGINWMSWESLLCIRMMVGWDLKVFMLSTLQCWESKDDVS
jgi:hypothetical protein